MLWQNICGIVKLSLTTELGFRDYGQFTNAHDLRNFVVCHSRDRLQRCPTFVKNVHVGFPSCACHLRQIEILPQRLTEKDVCRSGKFSGHVRNVPPTTGVLFFYYF